MAKGTRKSSANDSVEPMPTPTDRHPSLDNADINGDINTGSNAPRPAHSPRDANTSYTVLARRYRPQLFDECIGQEHVIQSLKNAIEGNRVAHAYLFTGARGVGKTSMARILAKALNCVRGPTTQPCGGCDICQGIAAGEDVDVIEIDGASNRGIDEVRELRHGIGYRPSRSRYKVYIIDEVHMLTRESFNALLKTLEEPPAHAKFIFATTEPQKIPITILSRCQRFDFSGIEIHRILDRLKQIVAAEGMEADEEALEIIARRAGGSMRDSQSLLDQLLAFGGERLSAEVVHRVLGTAGDERIVALTTAVFAHDIATCLQLVDSAVMAGVQLGEWVEQMLEFFRDLMVLSAAPTAPLLSMPNRLRDTMRAMVQGVSLERILEMMDLLTVCRIRMRSSSHSRVLVEMALVRLCRLDHFLNLGSALMSGPPPGVTVPDRPPVAARPATPPPLPPGPSSGGPPAGDTVKKKLEINEHALTGGPPPESPTWESPGRESSTGDISQPSPPAVVSSRPPSQAIGGASPKAIPPISSPQPVMPSQATLPSPPNFPSRPALREPAAPPVAHDTAPKPQGVRYDWSEKNTARVWQQLLQRIDDVVLGNMLGKADKVEHKPPNVFAIQFPGQFSSCKSFCEQSSRQTRVEEIIRQLTGEAVSLRFELAAIIPGEDPLRKNNITRLRDVAAKEPLVRRAEEILGAKLLSVDQVNTAPKVPVTPSDAAPVDADSQKEDV